jgi:hypothetical protein
VVFSRIAIPCLLGGFALEKGLFWADIGLKIHVSGYFQMGISQKDLARGEGMLAVVGGVFVRLSVVGGYLLEDGSFMALMQFVEFIIIGGAAAGALPIQKFPLKLGFTFGKRYSPAAFWAPPVPRDRAGCRKGDGSASPRCGRHAWPRP